MQKILPGLLTKTRANTLLAAALAAVFWFGPAGPTVAADWGLTLFVLSGPQGGDGAGPQSYSPGSRAHTTLLIENRGEAPLANVRVEVSLVGATPVVAASGDTAAWSRDGNIIRTTIGQLSVGQTVDLPLIVELADGTERGARGTGGEARIRASVPASGETLVAQAVWPITSCADDYHAALRIIRFREFAALRAAVDASRVADTELPGRTAFTYRPGGSRSEASAVRFAEQIAQSRGHDSYFLTQDLRWISDRLIADIAKYLEQDRYPGLCTGVIEWTGILEAYFGRFTKRVDQIAEIRANLMPSVLETVAGTGEAGMSQGSGELDAADTAAALLETIRPSASAEGQAIFVEAHDALQAPGDLPAERRAALETTFAALERLWYLEYALGNARSVADGFTGTLEAIRSAHVATCSCGS